MNIDPSFILNYRFTTPAWLCMDLSSRQGSGEKPRFIARYGGDDGKLADCAYDLWRLHSQCHCAGAYQDRVSRTQVPDIAHPRGAILSLQDIGSGWREAELNDPILLQVSGRAQPGCGPDGSECGLMELDLPGEFQSALRSDAVVVVRIQAHAHDPMQDGRQEANHRVSVDTFRRAMEDQGNRALALEYPESALDVGQRLVAPNDVLRRVSGHDGNNEQLAVHPPSTGERVRVGLVVEQIALQVDHDERGRAHFRKGPVKGRYRPAVRERAPTMNLTAVLPLELADKAPDLLPKPDLADRFQIVHRQQPAVGHEHDTADHQAREHPANRGRPRAGEDLGVDRPSLSCLHHAQNDPFMPSIANSHIYSRYTQIADMHSFRNRAIRHSRY